MSDTFSPPVPADLQDDYCPACARVAPANERETDPMTHRRFHRPCADIPATYHRVDWGRSAGCTFPSRAMADKDIADNGLDYTSGAESVELTVAEVTMTPRQYGAMPDWESF